MTLLAPASPGATRQRHRAAPYCQRPDCHGFFLQDEHGDVRCLLCSRPQKPRSFEQPQPDADDTLPRTHHAKGGRR